MTDDEQRERIDRCIAAFEQLARGIELLGAAAKVEAARRAKEASNV